MLRSRMVELQAGLSFFLGDVNYSTQCQLSNLIRKKKRRSRVSFSHLVDVRLFDKSDALVSSPPVGAYPLHEFLHDHINDQTQHYANQLTHSPLIVRFHHASIFIDSKYLQLRCITWQTDHSYCV
jgi:hypothetical protein